MAKPKPDVRHLYNKHELPIETPQFMNDGVRRIDYVLMYEEEKGGESGEAHQSHGEKKDRKEAEKRKHEVEEQKKREFFEENLVKEGLQLEYDRRRAKGDDDDKKKKGEDKVQVFVKIHCPWAVLCRWAEVLKIKMPLRLVDRFDATKTKRASVLESRRLSANHFGWTRGANAAVAPEGERAPDEGDGSEGPITGRPNFITMPFERKRIDKFAIFDPDTFFSPSQRQEIAHEVLQKARNDPNDDKKRGIESLLEEKVYEAFPLHDGDFVLPDASVPMEQWCNRQRLRYIWASWSCFFTRQPYELIRSYFGEKVALYFAFLGFYTKWLIFPTLTGLGVLLYGAFYTGDDELVEDICEEEHGHSGALFGCPLCKPPNCEFERMAEGCVSAQWDYRMDNEATPVMAALTIIWATVYLKAWKRREATLAYDWDTYDLELEDDIIRPEYEERAPARHRNFITREIEPYVPKKTRLWWKFLSTLVTIAMLILVTVALVVLVLARIALYGALKQLHVPKYAEVARILIHLVILGMVMLFDIVYGSIAEKLTSYECPRTQTQWMTSFLWKLFIFELTNDFVPIIYAAWVKGRLSKTPLELNMYTELCEPGGCMNEVTEVIAFLLLGRLVVGNTTEIGIPLLKSFISRWRSGTKQKSGESAEVAENKTNQCVHDALAEGLELDGVAEEYMEMMVQFAFCTLFVPALPVAPLVCFVNNLLEIRVDAIKFIIHRRPLPIRAPGVQIWNNFLDIVAKIAVVSNAGLIAFTSDTLPRLYYKYAKKEGESYEGWQMYSLSALSSEYWPEEVREELEHENITVCYYNDYRHPEEPFSVTQDWWETWTVRFAFFGVFLVVAFTFQFMYNFIVPDVPSNIRMQIQRRRYVLNKGLEQAAAADSSEKWLKQAIHGKGTTSSATSESRRRRKTEDGDLKSMGPNMFVEELK